MSANYINDDHRDHLYLTLIAIAFYSILCSLFIYFFFLQLSIHLWWIKYLYIIGPSGLSRESGWILENVCLVIGCAVYTTVLYSILNTSI